MRLTVIVPSWMVGDGAYEGLGVGDRVELGLALEAGSVARRSTSPGVAQAGRSTVLTTVAGRLEHPPDGPGRTSPALVRGGGLAVLVPAANALPHATDVVATGFLTAEPYLWAEGAAPRQAAPDGVAIWEVAAVRERNGGEPRDLARIPAAIECDPEVAYLLDVTRRDAARPGCHGGATGRDQPRPQPGGPR